MVRCVAKGAPSVRAIEVGADRYWLSGLQRLGHRGRAFGLDAVDAHGGVEPLQRRADARREAAAADRDEDMVEPPARVVANSSPSEPWPAMMAGIVIGMDIDHALARHSRRPWRRPRSESSQSSTSPPRLRVIVDIERRHVLRHQHQRAGAQRTWRRAPPRWHGCRRTR